MNESVENSEERVNSTRQEAKAPAADDPGNKLTAIEGLNVEKGIALTGKNMGYYLKILSIFYRDGIIKKTELIKSLETDDIELFTIHIHAIKSAAALIGADTLSKDAAELEEAGKQGDMAFIKSRSYAFLMDLEELLCNINKAHVFGSGQTGKNTKISTETEIDILKIELLRLKKALNAFDSSEIYRADGALQKFTHAPDIGDYVSAILQFRLVGDFEKAISLIDKLL